MSHSINPVAQAVMQHLLQGGIEAAERYVQEELLPAVERAKTALEVATAGHAAAVNIINLSKATAPDPGRVGSPAPAPQQFAMKDGQYPPYPAPEPEDKRMFILQAALNLSEQRDVISTEDVQKLLEKAGKAVGGQRPGTSIGNVLNRDGRWERVEEGKYRKRAASAS